MTTVTQYIIKRYNKRFNNKLFTRYEEARSYVRKWLRSREASGDTKAWWDDAGWTHHSNPSITMYDFSIAQR